MSEHDAKFEAARQRMTKAKAAFTDAVQLVHRREPGAVRACGIAIREVNRAREELAAMAGVASRTGVMKQDAGPALPRARARFVGGG